MKDTTKATATPATFAPAVMDPREAAHYLRVSLTTVLRLVRAGELPHTRVGRSIRFRPADLDGYLEAKTTPAGGKPEPGDKL